MLLYKLKMLISRDPCVHSHTMMPVTCMLLRKLTAAFKLAQEPPPNYVAQLLLLNDGKIILLLVAFICHLIQHLLIQVSNWYLSIVGQSTVSRSSQSKDAI